MAQAAFSLQSLSELRARLAQMKPISAADAGELVPFTVRGNGNVLDQPVVSRTTGVSLMKKVYNTDLLNQVSAEYHKGLLAEAAKLEALGQREEASEKLLEFLNRCTLSFSVLENQSAFNGLANGMACKGVVEFREGTNKDGQPFQVLTLNGSSVQAREAKKLSVASDSFLDNLLGSSEPIPSAPAAAPAPKAPAPAPKPSAPVMKLVEGVPYSVADLAAAGWAPADIAALPNA